MVDKLDYHRWVDKRKRLPKGSFFYTNKELSIQRKRNGIKNIMRKEHP